MSKWEGKSKGKVLGYKIFTFFISKLGVKSAYFLLYFVTLYYFLFSSQGRTEMYWYFNKRLGYSKFKSVFKVYVNQYIFGKTIVDKIAILSGLSDKFTYNHDGGQNITRLLKEKKGGILISAHVGNFEISEYFFNEMEGFSQINLVTTDNEHAAIKDYLESVSIKSNIKFIIVKDDMSHIFDINNALNNNELICFTGDRYFEGNKVLEGELLGKKTFFPAGPFLLGSRLDVPVLFVYVMKETAKHYHLYAKEAKFKKRDAQDLLKEYTKSIEDILKIYPYQWFNYFDFWNEKK